MDFKKYINVVEDFPKPGISFKDMSPLLLDPTAFKNASDELTKMAKELNPTVIVGPESRGFVFGTVIAYNLDLGFVMARKNGKLPGNVMKATYKLEYGEDSITLPENSIKKGDKVVLVDDLIATGGTLEALTNLIRSVGAEVVGVICLVELEKVRDPSLVKDVKICSLIKYDY